MGALCEAIERYSFTFLGGESVRRASLAALGDEGLHPNTCGLYSMSANLPERKEWNETHKAIHRVPPRFDPGGDLRLDAVLVPDPQRSALPALVLLVLRLSRQPGETNPCYSDSNGNAAGSQVAEAILQGLFELVRAGRDRSVVVIGACVRRWSGKASSCPTWNSCIATMPAPAGTCGFWNLTTDLEWPTFAALSARKEDGRQVYFGFGCHSDPKVALTRAATEINQFFVMACMIKEAAVPEDATPKTHAEALWLRDVNLRRDPWLAPSPAPRRRLQDYSTDCGGNGLERVRQCPEFAGTKGAGTARSRLHAPRRRSDLRQGHRPGAAVLLAALRAGPAL